MSASFQAAGLLLWAQSSARAASSKTATAALGICHAIPSAETLRQRFGLIGSSIRRQVLDENIKMLKSNGIVPSKLPCGYVPVDMDVSPFDNSKTCKEGVSRTYKGCDGYATMFAYVGSKGYLANLELRKGKQEQ